ncbi:expressed unknown protein [Seminavis robusta]|uniref:Transmembrane protein n=1 Tax=Seminavis robusta TaxID=568900 RepID=A0A9N8DLC9_9STRA|nr:expressed unknown protein [Seminavis robusta]|eukprot:Sro188_g081130.1 n/a (433) ;mRNA; f:23828-25374
MPTRIVLRESTPPSRLSPSVDEEVLRSFTRTPPPPSRLGPHPRVTSSQRKVVGFRSSILREFSHNEGIDEDFSDFVQDEAAEKRRLQLHLSNEDIRASSRLLGYLFAFIASTVMLTSVVQFYLGEEKTFQQARANQLETAPIELQFAYNETQWPAREYFRTINGPVYLWKLWACIGTATAGVLMFLVILLMHFDTICFPKTWFQFFRDGSLAERNLLIAMVVFWCVGLHINTASLSVGEVQANVFVTTWIVFICTVLNLGVWRQSANLPRLAVKVLTHHRETTYNWAWTLIFVLITAGAGTDMYWHRDDILFQLEGEVIVLNQGDWTRILVMVWSEVFLCFMALFFNHVWSTALKLNFPGGCRFVLNWRFLEGLLISSMVAFKFWVILKYTGADGVISGVNNTYCGIFGSFFSIVFTFGTWLRENKDIDYII